MAKKPTAKDVMTKNPTWCPSETPIYDIAKKMKSLDIGIIPIGDGKKLLGMVTDRDIVLSLAERKNPEYLTAKDVMNPGVYYCYENDDIQKVAKSMEKLKVRLLIVLSNEKDKKLTGIVSVGDIASCTHDRKLCGEIIEFVSGKERRKAA